MAPLLHDEIIAVGKHGFDKPALGGDHRQGTEDIDLGDLFGETLQPFDLRGDLFTDLVKQPVLQIGHLFLGLEDERFLLFQFRRYESLGVGQRLFPFVASFRQRRQVGLRHFDIVAEHLVVADFQRFDAGRLAFRRLQLRNPALAVRACQAQLVQPGMETALNDAAVPDRHRRFVRNRRFNQFGQIAAIVHIRRDGPERRGWGCRAKLFDRRNLP
ncbi:hypothetical protein D1872_237910 [compost metagenome]